MAAVRPNPTLSEDLISEILLRHANTTQTHQALLLRTRHDSPAVISLLDVESRQIVSDVKLPSRGEPVPCCIPVGSANGIVCVIVLFSRAKLEARIYLWNPATRRSKLIPRCAIEHDVLGFGYDPIDHEYKIVSSGPPGCGYIEVYLANRDEWRELPDPPYLPLNGFFDVCVNGFLCGKGEGGMMVFDLHKEMLNYAVKRPIIIRDVDGDDDETRVIEFNKSIAVIILWDSGLNDNKKINMWSLDDDECLRGGGVEASWTPMFSIDLASIGLAVPAKLILGYFNNGDLLVLTGMLFTTSFKIISVLQSGEPKGYIAAGAIKRTCEFIENHVDKKVTSGFHVMLTREAKIVPLSVEMGHACHYTQVVYNKYTESLV
ncbi:hypothetical protein POM88_052692 [Heracleum sosnowskyi]|uniref:F-box associated beta-propeller type 3 domain-containing protein n=1 Tax=Heracleum sosnowskyi TaxID=360622 RepID=A0AAD8GQY7_9APIA|nr:hypothetical protein POM88_052692 [Heracleum sosnowskyi]